MFFNIVDKISFLRANSVQRDLFKSIEVGDVIWAMMPLKDEEISKVEESHRSRPYLVMHKDEGNVYCYMSTHSPISGNNCKWYNVERGKYNSNKPSYFSLTKIYKIPVFNLSSKYYTLSNEDRIQIQKRLDIQKNTKNIKQKYGFNIKVLPEKNDIIKIKGIKYLIYHLNDDVLCCYEISDKEKSKENVQVTIGNNNYFLYYDEKLKININEEWKIIGIASSDEVNNILNMISTKKRQKNCTKQKELSNTLYAGDVVLVSDEKNITKPFLFIQKDEENLYGYMSTDTNPTNLNYYEKYYIYCNKYNLNKSSYFKLNEVCKIPIYNLVKRSYTLLNGDRKAIQKRLDIQKNRNMGEKLRF